MSRDRWSPPFLPLLVLLLALAAVRSDAQPAAPTVGPIVVQNSYWAKPGLEDEVYRHRLYASEVRAGLGLAAGRVMRRVGGSDTQPDVVWQCEYANEAAREADVAALTASGAFEPVMETMGTLIQRFDRAVWRVAEPAGEAAGD